MLLLSSDRNREGLGLVWFDRKPLEVRSYKDDKTEANVWAGRARWGAGFGDYRAMSYVSFPQADLGDVSPKATANADAITPVMTGISAVKNVG